jgi:hypothetical protein
MANNENSGFFLRWNTIWDENFPDEWLLFIRKMKFSVQQELRESLEQGTKSTPTYVSVSYANFLKDYNEKYCKNWKESPPENCIEEYFSLLQKECLVEVLKETKYKTGNFQPSWVTNLMLKLLFSTMEKYRQSKYPLTLLQLCRTTLRQGDVLHTLRSCFGKINEPSLRGKLFHTQEINSD